MSLSDWMSDADYEWRTRLQPVNLVVEADFTADEVREAQRNYGLAVKHLRKQGLPYSTIIKRYPGLTLMILVGHAALAYDHGAYWESFWDQLGLSRDADFENEIRQRVVELLDKFSLARFPDIESESAYKYVMMFALHAGIPVHCLRDLLVVINDHITQGRPPSGAAVMEWLQEPGKEYRTDALNVPVRNFLVHGAEFAADILDRIIEFIEDATADPQFFGRHLDPSTTGLPSVLLDELISQLKDRPLHFERKGLVAARGLRPAFAYLVDDDEIVLTLPTPRADVGLPWRISLDGQVRDIHVARRWGDESSTAVARAPIPAPTREAIIFHPSMSAPSSLSLVVHSDPLLTFDRNGKWIPRGDGLKDCVWAVFPDNHELVDARTGDQVQSHDSGCPAGWFGWRSAFVELDEVDGLQLKRDDTLVGSARWVRKDARPRFELGQPVTGVVAMDGRTVYSKRPWVMLPATRTDPAPTWNVRVRRLGESEWLVDEPWLGEEVETCVDPFDDAEEPQLGLFEILVTGPMGSDARCVLFLAEGLGASFAPSIRVPVSGGLTPCTAEVVSDGVSIASEERLEFGTRVIEVKLGLRSEDTSAEVLLKPPHVEIRSGEVGVPVAWRMTADVLDPEDFSQDRFVAVRAPGVERVQFGYYSEFGDLIQQDSAPRKRQNDVFESRTQQYADTVRNHPSGRVVATLFTGDVATEVTVLQAQPRRLASNVRLHRDTLHFTDPATVDDLAVYVWSSTAPWRPPEVLPVHDGKATLPEHLVDAGELRCQLFVDDPWVMLDPPAVPPEGAFVVEQLGWREDGTPAQVKLARYLAGPRRAPVEVGAVPEVWAALARLHADGKEDRFAGLIELLTAEPRKALECLGDSTIPAGEKMAMLIRSELVNHSFSVEDTFNELHWHPWFGCMVELADLPSLFNRRHTVPAERAETLAYLRDRGGVVLMELLRTGKTARFHDASFDSRVVDVSALPVSRVEAKLQEIQHVPRAQLDPENLRVGVYEALCRRTEWMSSGWSPSFAKQVAFVVNPIGRASKVAQDAITLRIDRLREIDVSEHPWMLMSVESLTLAFLARLEANGRIEGRYLNSGLLKDWARLAQLCPTMVANDLLIAEAAVLYDRRGDLTGEEE